jgi:hypothetical protein
MYAAEVMEEFCNSAPRMRKGFPLTMSCCEFAVFSRRGIDLFSEAIEDDVRG